MLLRLSSSLSDLLYISPRRESQVLVMSENHITPLELQFCFGTLLFNSVLLQSFFFFFLCFERQEVEISVKDGPPWSLLAVNQHLVLTGSTKELVSQPWFEIAIQKVFLHYKPQSVVFIATEYYFQPWQT